LAHLLFVVSLGFNPLTAEYFLADWLLYVERNMQVLPNICQKMAEYIQFIADCMELIKLSNVGVTD
jgi:hypothetical protein